LRFAFRDLSLSFPAAQGRLEVLRAVNIEAGMGEFVSIVGPSGCGKTSMLRAIAGFVAPDAGSIEFPATHHRSSRCAMLYQDNSLFPWRTVIDNACFGLEAQGVPRAERERLALPLLRRFGLGDRIHAWPHQLSVGMRQRVAVIRVFLSDADLLLMDEPFAALDSYMRLGIQQDLLKIWELHHKTVLFVTHDLEEAILLSDRIIVMSDLPSTVVAQFPISFQRPRDSAVTLSDEFVRLKREIYDRLHLTAAAHAHAS
jgi:ABC-type nitrate/sulfonate/bicarbonate transport system ATPase subunit